MEPQPAHQARLMQANRREDRSLLANYSSQQQQQHNESRHQQPQARARRLHQNRDTIAPPSPIKQQKLSASSPITLLLPQCTAEAPLNESQVIALTDVAGSLKELVLLALGAKDGDDERLHKLQNALGGEQVVAGVVDFFSDEFEIG